MEMTKRRKMEVLCVQETKWKGDRARKVVELGDEESIGRFGWGTSGNREGRALVDMLRRNGLAVAGTFFQKKESQKITYMSELHKIVVRQQQLRRVKDCVAGRVCHHTAQTVRL